MKPDYLLLHCDQDQSHVIVPSEDVVYVNVPKIGEKVRFYYDADRTYIGKVIEMGEGPESFAHLVKLQNELNRKQNREESFDPNKPRTAALKQKEVMKQIIKSGRKPKVPPPKRNQQSENQSKQGMEESLSDDEATIVPVKLKKTAPNGALDHALNLNDTSDDETTHSKQSDLATIKSIPRHRDAASPTSPVSSLLTSPPSVADNVSMGSDTIDNADIDDAANERRSKTELRAKCVRKRRPRSVKPGVNVKKIEFKGKMHKFNQVDEKAKVVELYEGSRVYLLKADLNEMRRTANTSTKVARALMDGIFTDEALLECSLHGEISTGGGPDNYTQRTALDKTTVTAIIDFTLRYSKMRSLPCSEDSRPIAHAMSSKLNELRYGYKKRMEEEAVA